MGIASNEWCATAVERATNKEEIIEFFADWIRKGIIIRDSSGFEDTGMTEDEALTKMYVLNYILKSNFGKDFDADLIKQ